MAATLNIENTKLFANFLKVCNAALAANSESFPYKQILTVSEKVLGGRNFAAQVYGDEPDVLLGSVTVRFADGQFQPVGDGEHDPVFRVKIGRDYMDQVVRHRDEYIDHPEKLDWDWLKSRLGVGQGDGVQEPVGEVMTYGVHSVDHRVDLRHAARLMRDLDVGALPVTDGRTVVGIVTDRDIAIRAVSEGLDPNVTPVDKVMTPGIVSCREDARVADAARAMEDLKVRRLLVIGRNDKPVGVVSLGDLASHSVGDQLLGRVMSSVSSRYAPPD